MFGMLIAAVHYVEEKDVPTVLLLLWGAVIGGGILGMVTGIRLFLIVATLAIFPALTLSCSAASS